MLSAIDPLTAAGIVLATAATDAIYVMFTAAVLTCVITATFQPVSGLGCIWTSCPSSARPSLIISANLRRLSLISA